MQEIRAGETVGGRRRRKWCLLAGEIKSMYFKAVKGLTR